MRNRLPATLPPSRPGCNFARAALTLILLAPSALPAGPGPAPAPARARVTRVTDSQSVKLLTPNPARVRKMVNAVIMEHTSTRDVASAWKKIVLPSDRVGINIHTCPGPVMSTRPEVVEAVIEGLALAGVPKANMIVFDRYATHMENAGYTPGSRDDGVLILPAIPSAGYDPTPSIEVPIPGRLVWGDLEFDPKQSEDDNQLSTKSHFTKILTQKVDKVINLAVPTTDPTLGLYGCQLGASLSLIDNYRRLQRPSYTREDSLTEIFANPIIQKKVVLHIMDALIGQYAGGQGFDPNYCWTAQTISVSRDAVALDALTLHEINLQRPKSELGPIKDESAYIQAAADANLGIADLSRIDVVDVKP